MRIFNKQISMTDASDANLVMYSLGGNRDAFCQIVTRYQNLLCSLAYSAIGDIKHSEDVAQETFVEAWKKLNTLHDPEKLKAWLCGMLRFKVSHFHRKQQTQPTKHAEQLTEAHCDLQQSDELEGRVIDEQHHTLMWKVLDEIDIKYREPLVLFYREQQSVERVASELELSKGTVKQRLSRGRKLLKEAMSTLVEEGLQKSKPGSAFTIVVMTSISGIAPPVKATALGAGAVKTGSFFQLTTLVTFLAVFSGVIGSFFSLRASLDQSRTQRERYLAKKSVGLFFLFALIFIIGMFAFKYLASNNPQYAPHFAILSQLLVLFTALIYVYLVKTLFAEMANLRAHERIFEPQAFTQNCDLPHSKQRQYISKLALFGVPLIHVQFGMPEHGDKPAYGWVAAGSRAYGLLFAWGGVAIAPISVGIVSVGVVTVGAVGFGLLSAGTLAIGIFAFGASAIGYKAYSSLSSLGWESALSGGFAIAKEGAVGAVAFAKHTNNQLAQELSHLVLFEQEVHWLLALIAAFVIIPAMWHSHKVRKRMGQ